MNVQLIVFDIAGTTVKDDGNVADCFISSFAKYGITVSAHEVNMVMGFRKKDAIRIVLENKPDFMERDVSALIENIHDAFTASMISFYKNDAKLQPLPYVEETFSWLKQKGVKLTLNTGFTKAITDVILQRLQWDIPGTVDAVISSDEVPDGRPHPAMIRQLMKMFNISDAARVVKVGDTEVDIEEGRNAGCGLVISVTSGAYSRQELEKFYPDHIIENLAALPALIK